MLKVGCKNEKFIGMIVDLSHCQYVREKVTKEWIDAIL